jgi:iron-sulfur cluster repair protein YtfE (RIC family)
MIFVIDIRVIPHSASGFHRSECAIQDLYQQPIIKLVEFIIAAYHENRDINLEVFVHKAEKLAEDDKLGERSLFAQ